MKTCFALAALAVMGLASAAYAGDAAKPKAMSDSEMDKVTAAGPPDRTGQGVITGFDASGGKSSASEFGITTANSNGLKHGIENGAGVGRCTTRPLGSC